MSVSLAPPALISPVFVPPVSSLRPPVTRHPSSSSRPIHPHFRLLVFVPSRSHSTPSFSISIFLSLSLASLHDLSRLYPSPRPRHPSIGRLWTSRSLFLYLSRSLYPYSTLSVPFPRCRDLSRLFPLFPVVFETVTGSPMFVGIVDAPLFIHPHSADRSPLQRRPRRPSYVHTPFLALSLSLSPSIEHAHTTHTPPPCSSFFLFPSSPRDSYAIFRLSFLVSFR